MIRKMITTDIKLRGCSMYSSLFSGKSKHMAWKKNHRFPGVSTEYLSKIISWSLLDLPLSDVKS